MLNFKIEISPKLKFAPVFVAETFASQLLLSLDVVAIKMVAYMRSQLVPGHGYDTGKLHDSLKVKLVKLAFDPGFDIVAEDVDYWAYVEFGHMQRDGNWWEGYHYAAKAMQAHMEALQGASRVAWKTTAQIVNRSGFTLPDFR